MRPLVLCTCLPQLVLGVRACVYSRYSACVHVFTAGTHELTLVHEFAAMSSWCGKFATSTPAPLVACFSTQLTAKSSTSAVRTAVVNCISATFNGRLCRVQITNLISPHFVSYHVILCHYDLTSSHLVSCHFVSSRLV